MSHSEDLSAIETKVNDRKNLKTKKEERLKIAQENKNKLLEELKETGISEEELEGKISDLKVKLEEGIEKCQTLLG